MESFGEQHLGEGFHFEKDPMALASILNDQGLTPKLEPKAFKSCLTPTTKINKEMSKYKEMYDFFEGKNGVVFFRPSAKFSSGKKFKANQENGSMAFRAMRKNIKPKIKPQRVAKKPQVTSSDSGNFHLRSRNKNHPQSEKKLLPFFPPPHRQSISERKAIPNFEGMGRRYGKSLCSKPMAAKALAFGPSAEGNKSDFEFARPLTPSPKIPPQSFDEQPGRSKVELILMREGLIGLPRESLGCLLRQSMTPAELATMFDDDSTTSFEELERRLKTPLRPKIKKIADPVSFSINGQLEKLKDDKGDYEEEKDMEEEPIGEEKGMEEEPIGEEKDENLEGEEDDGDGSIGASSLNRSASLVDISSTNETATPVFLRSTSELDFRNQNERDKVEMAQKLQETKEAHAEYIRERENLESQMKDLMLLSRKRKDDFKLAWGISPAKVNHLRSKKGTKSVILNLQEVRVSEGVDKIYKCGEREERVGSEMEDAIFSAPDGDEIATN